LSSIYLGKAWERLPPVWSSRASFLLRADPRNWEAINKLLSNEKYTGRVLLQKTVRTGAIQIENDGLMERYLYTGFHEAIISDEMFMAVQQEKLKRTKNPENTIAMSFTF